VPVHFKSFISGSSGNCAMLWNRNTRLYFDCGFRAQRDCLAMLAGHVNEGHRAAVLVSHSHSDHINHPSLTVLSDERIPVHCHLKNLRWVREHNRKSKSKHELEIKTFEDGAFEIGDFKINPIPLKHQDGFNTHGFYISTEDAGKPVRVVLMTDFHQYEEDLLGHLINADFIFIEANHDRDLLRKHPNYNSRYHMLNEKTGELLCRARKARSAPPRAVVLGHLSEARNKPHLAIKTIREIFEKNGQELDFELDVAPRHEESKTYIIE
jgi:ribonuclease BN (tRNA processing enzyme)